MVVIVTVMRTRLARSPSSLTASLPPCLLPISTPPHTHAPSLPLPPHRPPRPAAHAHIKPDMYPRAPLIPSTSACASSPRSLASVTPPEHTHVHSHHVSPSALHPHMPPRSQAPLATCTPPCQSLKSPRLPSRTLPVPPTTRSSLRPSLLPFPHTHFKGPTSAASSWCAVRPQAQSLLHPMSSEARKATARATARGSSEEWPSGNPRSARAPRL